MGFLSHTTPALGLALTVALLAPVQAGAATMQTANAGSGAPVDMTQPTLALNPIINIAGPFQTLGEVKYFGGNFAPNGYALAQGQLLSIAQNTALFSLLGTTYGGDGQVTFALPDLRGRTILGEGTGPGLSPSLLGQKAGAETTTLGTANMPAHNHLLPNGDPTTFVGSGVPFDIRQPSLTLDHVLPLVGLFPSPGGGIGFNPMLGRVQTFAGNNVDFGILNGYASAEGQLLPISQNQALFSILGTTYGGDGITTFALPDLRGRAAMGDGAGPGLTPTSLGHKQGQETVALSVNEMPAHDHGLPPSPSSTDPAGGGQDESNKAPTLTLKYMVATQGLFPSRSSGGAADPNDILLGEIGLFAGNFEPGGWMEADGRLLSIAQHSALFSLFGTIYGGDGRTNFALPDLRGRVAVGFGQGPGLDDWSLGEKGGTETLLLSEANLPTHNHEYDLNTVDAPATLGLFGLGLVGLGLAARRRR